MWLLNGLFAVFVAFQVFEAIVSYQASDVSYAQQARSGFFQLVWVGAIVVVVVLVLDWLVHQRNHARLHRQQRILVRPQPGPSSFQLSCGWPSTSKHMG